MIELYLDCEFNGNKGSFISIALYNPKGESFYEVSDFWKDLIKYKNPFGIGNDCALKPWVLDNVIPVLGKTAIPKEIIQSRLTLYLHDLEDEVTIYADWPEDFTHLCDLLYITHENKPPEKTIRQLTMKLITTPDVYISKIPHNALEDAKALYLNHPEMFK